MRARERKNVRIWVEHHYLSIQSAKFYAHTHVAINVGSNLLSWWHETRWDDITHKRMSLSTACVQHVSYRFQTIQYKNAISLQSQSQTIHWKIIRHLLHTLDKLMCLTLDCLAHIFHSITFGLFHTNVIIILWPCRGLVSLADISERGQREWSRRLAI